MAVVNAKIKRLYDGAILPAYGTAGACALDLFACLNRPIKVHGGETQAIPTGIAVELPTGYGLLIVPRSGLAFKHGVTVLNTPGLVDTDYRGEVKVILHNHMIEPFYVNPDARIAQMLILPIPEVKWTEVSELSDTHRGAGGFGSTGM